MAVNRGVVANWVSGDNEIQVSATPVRLNAIEIQGNPEQGAAAYVRVWDLANPVPGTTEPAIVVPVFRPNVQDGKIRQKVILGGMRLPTALAWGVYTTPHTGNTAPAQANAPLSVQIFYDPA
jgi:hypothetical protein